MPKNIYGVWEPESGIEAYIKLPTNLRGAMRRYIEKGEIPGRFLTAVIQNNLHGAVFRADTKNTKLLKSIVLWIYNEAPAPCWGSDVAMLNWSKARKKEAN